MTIDAMTVEDADRHLDQAWLAGGDVEAALALAKRISRDIGRDPVIEDAKVLLARTNGCTPSQAFEFLVKISQTTNQKVSEISRRIVSELGDSSEPGVPSGQLAGVEQPAPTSTPQG
jgi:AmiR/NasT family two-component response regulator